MPRHRTIHIHLIPGHHCHIIHGVDIGRPEHRQSRRVTDGPDLVSGVARVYPAVLRAHRRDVDETGEEPLRVDEVPDPDAEALDDRTAVETPGHLGEGVAGDQTAEGGLGAGAEETVWEDFLEFWGVFCKGKGI